MLDMFMMSLRIFYWSRDAAPPEALEMLATFIYCPFAAYLGELIVRPPAAPID